MKQRGLSNLLILIYANFWYVPFFAFLLGLKICLVSFLVTSIHSTRDSINLDANSEWALNRNSIEEIHLNSSVSKVKRKNHHSISSPVTVKPIPKGVLEEWTLLANLEEARIRPSHSNRTDPESIWLIFNRLPRCGGSTLVKLLEKLGEKNGFAHQEHEYRTPWPRFLLEQEQENLVTWFEYQHRPKSYDRHFFFVNFTKYQKYVLEKPIYINLIRDPVLRIRSEYFTRRADSKLAELEISRRDKDAPGSGLDWYQRSFEECVLTSDPECEFLSGAPDFTLSVPFFCGQHNSCVIINDKWGLQMAKFTIERHYSVVGVLERMDQTLAVLENYVPKFFSGVSQLYTQLDAKDQKLGDNPRNLLPVSDSVRTMLESKLHAEVELYRFVSQRLALQYAHLAGTY